MDEVPDPPTRRPPRAPGDLAPPAERFARFGAEECRDTAPLYAALAAGVAADLAVLALAAAAPPGQPAPNLLFAAVQDLLLGGVADPLAAYYPGLTADPWPPEDAYPAFAAFCRAHAPAIRVRLQTRLVQTNEVRRAACLLPAFARVAAREDGRPLALIEIGASAGLLLAWDRYGYDYGAAGRFGMRDAPVQLACEWRGPGPPAIPDPLPRVAFRVGLDLHPIDVRDPSEVRWLRALIWPEHRDRAALLDRALAVVAANPPPLWAGDALALLPAALAAAPTGATLCLYHSFVLNQFAPAARARLDDLLAAASAWRPIYRISLEHAASQQADLTVICYRGGAVTAECLAACQPHGAWIAWDAPP